MLGTKTSPSALASLKTSVLSTFGAEECHAIGCSWTVFFSCLQCWEPAIYLKPANWHGTSIWSQGSWFFKYFFHVHILHPDRLKSSLVWPCVFCLHKFYLPLFKSQSCSKLAILVDFSWPLVFQVALYSRICCWKPSDKHLLEAIGYRW